MIKNQKYSHKCYALLTFKSDKSSRIGLFRIKMLSLKGLKYLYGYAIVVSTITNFGIPKTFVRFFPAIKKKGQLYFLSLIIPLLGFVFALLFYYLFKKQIFLWLNASELLRDNFFYIIILVFFIGFFDVLTAISRSFLSAATPIFINEVFLKLYRFPGYRYY